MTTEKEEDCEAERQDDSYTKRRKSFVDGKSSHTEELFSCHEIRPPAKISWPKKLYEPQGLLEWWWESLIPRVPDCAEARQVPRRRNVR